MKPSPVQGTDETREGNEVGIVEVKSLIEVKVNKIPAVLEISWSSRFNPRLGFDVGAYKNEAASS